MVDNIFYRVQVCGIDGGDIRHEDFATLEEAEKHFNECEFDRVTETVELYKMIEYDGTDGKPIELVDVILQ